MRSHSVGCRYKVASDFYYLTGLEDCAEAVLLIAENQTYLLRPSTDANKQMWGDQVELTDIQLKNLQEIQFADLDKLSEIVQSLLQDCDRIAFAIGRDESLDQLLLQSIRYERNRRSVVLCDSRLLIGTLRLYKDENEIQLMREAARRSSRVHRCLMQQNLIGKSEREIANYIEAEFLREGMHWMAYETIVGSGERSKLLHARATDRIVQAGELILVDAGAEWQAYCADITRVISVDQKFSTEQKIIYQIVLDAQKAVLAQIRPGVTLSELHQLAEKVIAQGLCTHNYEAATMPHKTSHWIGLDVHDPATYTSDSGEALRLEKGMSFTVEPGLYLKDLNFGVRIEDDVVVTEVGCEVLSDAPKEIGEIESLRPWSS